MPAVARVLPLYGLAFSLRYLQTLMVTHSLWNSPLDTHEHRKQKSNYLFVLKYETFPYR